MQKKCVVSQNEHLFSIEEHGNEENSLVYHFVTRVLRTHTRCAVIVCAVSYYIASSEYVSMGT